jgi:hypothetical protein
MTKHPNTFLKIGLITFCPGEHLFHAKDKTLNTMDASNLGKVCQGRLYSTRTGSYSINPHPIYAEPSWSPIMVSHGKVIKKMKILRCGGYLTRTFQRRGQSIEESLSF